MVGTQITGKQPLNKIFEGSANNQLMQEDQMELFFAILLGVLTGEDSDDFSKFFDALFGSSVSDGFRDHLNTTIADARANHSSAGETAQKIIRYTGDGAPINPGEKAILDFISKYESKGDYNVVFGGRKVDLTSMTVDQILNWQKMQIADGAASSAAGRYQIISGTLKGLKEELGLTGNELFDEAMQDRMGLALLERRGLDQFMAGDISKEKFMRNLSQEWAALPKDSSDLSYYHGDGLNKAHVTAGDTLAMLGNAKLSAKEHFDAVASAREILDKTPAATPAPATQPMLG